MLTKLRAQVAQSKFLTAAVGSVGVVYGDIGTSPLYALKESVKATGMALSPDLVVGVVSLILWTLMVIVSLKYATLIMRADNDGEGGILALAALAVRAWGRHTVLIFLGMVGAALFYGDAVLTPAVSVLSAVEGMKIVAPAAESYVVPIALAVLVALFAIQYWGTATVARYFGPVMIAWFALLGLAGLAHVIAQPEVLRALNPLSGLEFLGAHPGAAFVTLGAVFLSVTGAEALYADMGHFGRRPIQAAWGAFVFPCLILNYLGQGALMIAHPEAAENPFFLLFPAWMLPPVVLLATAATVIASQAVISGAFSLTQQAFQLRILPRMAIRQTCEYERGQIFVSRVNWTILAVVIALVCTFRTSDSLAAAYGIAVTGTMCVTAILAIIVAWKGWGWPLPAAVAVVAPLLAIDLVFLASNALKVFEGGWLPLTFAAVMVLIMWTWRKGSLLVADRERRERLDLSTFLGTIAKSSAARVPVVAVFLTPMADEVPPALLHNLKHNKVLHERNIILNVKMHTVPRIAPEDRCEVFPLQEGWDRVVLNYGFMQVPDVARSMKKSKKPELQFDVMKTSFFLSRVSLRASGKVGMPLWQDYLFIFLSSLKVDASRHFHIPTQRTIEIGTQVTV